MRDATVEMVMAACWVVLVWWVIWGAGLWLYTLIVPVVGLPGSEVDRLDWCCVGAV